MGSGGGGSAGESEVQASFRGSNPISKNSEHERPPRAASGLARGLEIVQEEVDFLVVPALTGLSAPALGTIEVETLVARLRRRARIAQANVDLPRRRDVGLGGNGRACALRP